MTDDITKILWIGDNKTFVQTACERAFSDSDRFQLDTIHGLYDSITSSKEGPTSPTMKETIRFLGQKNRLGYNFTVLDATWDDLAHSLLNAGYKGRLITVGPVKPLFVGIPNVSYGDPDISKALQEIVTDYMQKKA